MVPRFLQIIFAALLLLPNGATAGPIKLKLSFFTSDRSSIYQCQIEPFVRAVNAERSDLIQIAVYFSGAISPAQDEQIQLVTGEGADLALVVPSSSPQRFADTAVMEMPGLFRDEFEASRIYRQLTQAGALEGYEKLLVLNSVVSAGESIHSRKPISRLDESKGQKIRVNNSIEADALRAFGALPIKLPLNRTMDALGAGNIDGVTVPPAMLFEFGFGRITTHHYMIRLGGVPTFLAMNRKKFLSLPAPAQDILRKHSGEQMSDRVASCFANANQEVLKQLRADQRRQVVDPSPNDEATIQRVLSTVRDQWSELSPHNRNLLARVQAEIAASHAAER